MASQNINSLFVSSLIARYLGLIKNELKGDEYLSENWIPKIDLDKNIEELDTADRIALLQSAGNAFRKKISKDILSQLVIKEIALKRDKDENEYGEEYVENGETKSARKSIKSKQHN